MFLEKVFVNGKEMKFKDEHGHIPVDVDTGDIVTLVTDDATYWMDESNTFLFGEGNALTLKAGEGDGRIWFAHGFYNGRLGSMIPRIIDTTGWQIISCNIQ